MVERLSMRNILRKYLRKLEERIDLEHQSYVRRIYGKIFAFEQVNKLPFIYTDPESRATDKDWPIFPYNDEFQDPAKMLLN